MYFQQASSRSYRFVNYTVNDKLLSKIISEIFKTYGSDVTVELLDSIKENGYKYATYFAPTIAISDIVVAEGQTEEG